MADDSGEDVVLFGPPTEDGEGYRVLRHTNDETLMGTVRPLKHGKPIQGEAVRLAPRQGPLPLYDVVHDDEARSGPAKVNSREFLAGWDRIFGQRSTVGQA
jgi:hypothetical protein